MTSILLTEFLFRTDPYLMMRRILVILTAIISLYSCGKNDTTKTAYFVGQAVEKYEASCLLEITDPGNQYFRKGDVVVVSTNVDGCPQYSVGDYLRIVYDGMVAESYPPQVFHVYSVHKTDEQGNNIN